MLRKPMCLILALWMVTSLACGVTIDMPAEVTAGPMQEERIKVDIPDAEMATLNLNFGAGELGLESGADGVLVEGIARYNLPDFKPEIEVDKNKISLETGSVEVKGIPKFNEDLKNEWDLKLGAVPMRLAITAGAYEGNYDLGGLSLLGLEIGDGAANVNLKFSEPNKAEMDVFRYTTGASNVEISGLANANFTSMLFRSGAGDYSLDFSGSLQRDAVVTVESGISNMVIIVPEGMSARLIFKGGLASVDMRGDWEKDGEHYVVNGSGPTLTITVDLSAGNLTLRTVK